MEQLLKTWEIRMLAYRKEADESKSSIERIKAINKFFAYRDCINELKKQLLIHSVSNRRELLIDFRNWWFGNRHSATNISNDEIDEFLGN